jgi:hypothetical protein
VRPHPARVTTGISFISEQSSKRLNNTLPSLVRIKISLLRESESVLFPCGRLKRYETTLGPRLVTGKSLNLPSFRSSQITPHSPRKLAFKARGNSQGSASPSIFQPCASSAPPSPSSTLVNRPAGIATMRRGQRANTLSCCTAPQPAGSINGHIFAALASSPNVCDII